MVGIFNILAFIGVCSALPCLKSKGAHVLLSVTLDNGNVVQRCRGAMEDLMSPLVVTFGGTSLVSRSPKCHIRPQADATIVAEKELVKLHVDMNEEHMQLSLVYPADTSDSDELHMMNAGSMRKTTFSNAMMEAEQTPSKQVYLMRNGRTMDHVNLSLIWKKSNEDVTQLRFSRPEIKKHLYYFLDVNDKVLTFCWSTKPVDNMIAPSTTGSSMCNAMRPNIAPRVSGFDRYAWTKEFHLGPSTYAAVDITQKNNVHKHTDNELRMRQVAAESKIYENK